MNLIKPLGTTLEYFSQTLKFYKSIHSDSAEIFYKFLNINYAKIGKFYKNTFELIF